MSDTFVVIWRASRRQRWFVQPHIHSGVAAERLARALVRQGGGEVWAIPVEIPSPDDANELEE